MKSHINEVIDYATEQAIKNADDGMLDQITACAGALDGATLLQLIHGQVRSTDMWISQWEKYKDISSVRNAAMAIGKLAGLVNALHTMNGVDKDVPEEIMAMSQKYMKIWEDLHISTEFAKALANNP